MFTALPSGGAYLTGGAVLQAESGITVTLIAIIVIRGLLVVIILGTALVLIAWFGFRLGQLQALALRCLHR